ncbi:hypothetical protein PFISCL1PPCAC_21319 [Pristionchus fissidentatus]|uniref:MATH domain-containing protein n=1 Tax=Pristionchus fissidentatus TaxID=1538716 RepID=A0AAV5WDS7_9BILA|nr:hypothetical protein PFISCL1PPCAC_21319 [Pristionchus fissidentatus]
MPAEPDFVIRMEIDELLDDDELTSDVVYAKDLPWSLLVSTTDPDRLEMSQRLSVMLLCDTVDECDWRFDATFEVVVHNVNTDKNGVEKRTNTFDFCFGHESCAFDWPELIDPEKILAIHSPVFSSMFFGDFAEKNQEEIELKEH